MDTVRVPLTQGKFAFIDAVDAERVLPFRWHAFFHRGKWYARRSGRRHLGEPSNVYMHRHILGTPPGLEVDHRNGDGLDNRRSNLRHVTRAQNCANVGKYKTNTSGYIGVYYSPNMPEHPWVAQIQVRGKNHRIGAFPTKEEAAAARADYARRLHGEFASRDEVV